MKWIPAIIAVLAEAGGPMDYKEITRRILKKGYRTATATTEKSVNSYLSTNPNLFRIVGKGTYELIETSVSVAKSVGGVAPVVVRSCSSYPSGAPEYKCASDFVDSEDLKNLSELEKELLELIVNFRLPLVNEDVCFADILDKLDVEILEEEGSRRQSIDAAHLREKLNELKEQIAEIDRKLQNNPQRQDLYGLRDNMRSVAEKVEDLLSKASDGKVEFDYPILGEFVPGSKPKVVIYLKSIENNLKSYESRWNVMVAVFVHEMFHAWNYFIAGGRSSVLAIDEPMVEFATLYFLKKLEAFTKSQYHSLKDEVPIVRSNRASRVRNKQQSIGDVAAYGFGYYLFTEFEKGNVDPIKWIETYSKQSASISRNLTVKKVEDALIPVYPFKSEDKVFKWFEKIIFSRRATLATTGKSTAAKVDLSVSLRK